jgi:hypothetical protein
MSVKNMKDSLKRSEELLEVNDRVPGLIDEKLYMDFVNLSEEEQKQILNILRFVDPSNLRRL